MLFFGNYNSSKRHSIGDKQIEAMIRSHIWL